VQKGYVKTGEGMARLKILHIVNCVGSGGSESGCIHLACFQADQHSVKVIGIKPPASKNGLVANELLLRLEQHGVSYEQLNFSNFPPRLFISAYCLWEIVTRYDPDVVHLHTDHPEYLFALIMPRTKALVVRTIRNTVIWPTSYFRGRFTENRLSHAVTAHFSEDSVKALNQRRSEYGLAPPEHNVVIPNAINRHCEYTSNEPVIYYCEGMLNLGYIGRLAHQKGLDVLLNALKYIPDNSIVLHVVGDGELDQKFRTIAKNINQTVNFYGAVPYARRVIKEFDCLVIPSRYEGFALISLEGQIERTPVIAAKAPGLTPTLPKDWPLSFDNENSLQLAKLISVLLESPQDMSILVELGFQNALKYTMAAQAERYNRLYLSHLGSLEVEDCPLK
jgi:glycosyltransferase involved in cell wall biosynthesis